MSERLYLYDTTLRDGAQTQGVDFTAADKVAIAQMLDQLGIDYIEGGWPGANPTDDGFFARPPRLGPPTPMNDKDRYWDCLDRAMEASHGGRTDDALAWLDEALRAQPNGAEAHNGRGEILWDEGKIDEALHEFERALRADSKFVTAHLNRAELLIEDLSEFEQAVTLCDELLAGRAELPRLDRATEGEVHYLKAKAVFYLDDLEGALFLVRRALKTAGEVGIYRSFEGQILFELGRLKRRGAPPTWRSPSITG